MLFIVSIIFAAALIQASVGFGFALVAMPLLALMLDVQSTAALTALCAFALSASMLARHWRAINIMEASGLIVSAIAGVPFGVALLAYAPRTVVLVLLGLLIASFSLYSLTTPKLLELKNRRWRFVAGFFGGVLGGAYNASGPPVVLYAAMRRWRPEKFLAVIQAFFVPVTFGTAAGHGLAGFWTQEIFAAFAFSLPAILAATFIGARIAARLSIENLSKAVYGLCFVLGLLIIATALRG